MLIINSESRPEGLPRRVTSKPSGWVMAMSWHDLLFIHYPVRAELLRPLIPSALTIDTFDGWAWIGVVPFRMSGVRPRFTPELRCVSTFPEINVRTYVKTPERSGVWFFSLDATNRLAVRVARALFGLPYFDARIACESDGEGVSYHSARTHRKAPPAEFKASYTPNGAVYRSEPDTIDYWLTERYCLFASNRRGRIGYGNIHHEPWSLQSAEAEITMNNMIQPLGISLPEAKPLLHFARRLDVVAWQVRSINTSQRLLR